MRFRTALVSASDRRAAAAGLVLATSSRPWAVWAQRATWGLVRVAGPRVLPGKREMHPSVDEQTLAEWTSVVGPADALAFYRRPQASRGEGITALLLRSGVPFALVKQRPQPDALVRESVALRALKDHGGLRGVQVPRELGSRFDGAHPWLAQQVLARRPHGPAWPHDLRSLTAIADQVSSVLGEGLSRPDGTPAHWRPAHGDLTPWNLRRAGGRTILIDWEYAGYAPPGADVTYYLAITTAAGLGAKWMHEPDATIGSEAASWWLERISDRSSEDADFALTIAVRKVLARWA